MASAVTTCSKTKKKKSFFPSIGSRRRLQEAVEQGQALDRVLAMPIFYDGPREKTTRYVPSKHDDIIDEMASRLLDDTMDDQLRSSPTPTLTQAKVWSSPWRSTPPGLPCTPNGARSAYPTSSDDDAKGTCFLDTHRRASKIRIEKASPGPCRKSSKHLEQLKGSISPGSGSGGMTRPLPKSKTSLFDPLRRNPTKFPSSATVNAGALACLEGRKPQDCPSQPSQHQEINRKLEAMLAATNALKPSPAGSGGAAPSAPSMMSRLKTRMASAFHKSGTKGKNLGLRSKSAAAICETRDGRSPRAYQPQTSRHPTRSIELRLNEGGNLNKKKVQQMTGGWITRKPVPEDGISLKGRRSEDDIFTEPAAVIKTPTDFERRLRDPLKSDESYVPPLPDPNPFESEKVWDSSVEAMLPSSPLASSTPRLRVHHTPGFSSTPVKKPGGQSHPNLSENRPTSSFQLRGKDEESPCGAEMTVPELGDGGTVLVRRATTKEYLSPSKEEPETLSNHVEAHPKIFDPRSDNETCPRLEMMRSSTPNEDGQKLVATRPFLFASSFEIDPFEKVSTKKHPSPTKQELEGYAKQLSASPSREMVNSRGLKHSKKHPSPSTRELQALEQQWVSYKGLGLKIPEEADELANSFDGSALGTRSVNAFGQGTTNRLVGNFGSCGGAPVDQRDSAALASISKVAPQSRIPRPVESQNRSRTTLAVHFHPTGADPLDIDELQWDASHYKIGHAAQVHWTNPRSMHYQQGHREGVV